MSINESIIRVRGTDVTKTVHREPYPTISPTRPELSQAGKSILITGGGTGVGFAIASAFIKASAATIIIVGRRTAVLNEASVKLEDEVKAAGKNTKILSRPCDVSNLAEVDTLWKYLADQGITVDVYVANAVKFSKMAPMLELGTEEIWSQLETNVKSPLYFTEKFQKQAGGRQTYLLSISTAAIHLSADPTVSICPAYILSKSSGTLCFQLLAQEKSHEKMQVVNIHPGTIYNDYLKSLGVDPENTDSTELIGSFAVWAATKEAAFLHGRFVWCSWDVNELSTGEIRKRLDEDFYYLRASVVGLRGGYSA